MKKFLAVYSIVLIVCVFSLAFFMTGCSQNSSKKDNKNSAWNIFGPKGKSAEPELVRLKNGVFVYKDASPSEVPPDYKGRDPFTSLEASFGPSKVDFSGEKSGF
jgi:hypothetical protein